ncbi:HlyC/CorC family transporter [SAR92 clade bacterium H231]|nr:HlyC/CorC family transporter [SAR92 clade bacterium H231]MDA7815612.1 HlyC/CorC family transporter [Porticoccaceae bacterium]MDA8902487.1 HlyC/CorC family transporter [Porticoccaceae bacterium]MDB2549911.1 HlyC/CorC family transporter [Porticoccaceae bacterium]MDC3248731.1 HlyC/CorC family transporter [Porticoccaceae bacterium]
MDGSHPLVLWLTLVVLLIVSAFFSGSETGMMSLNRYRLRHQRKKSSGARRAAKLLAKPDRLIGLILIGNNAVNILAAIIANMLAILYVGEAAAPWVATASLTITVLVFSEVTPKTIAAQNPEWFAFRASHILKPLLQLLTPLVWLVNKLTNAVISLLGFDPNKDRDDGLDTEELKSLVDVSGHKLSDSNQGMLKGILDLENVTVEDIMIPRNEIKGLDLEDSIEELMNTIVSSEYTRQPLYEGDINNIVGIFHVRKANHLLRSEQVTHKALMRFAEDVYFIPESTTLTQQLLNFKKNRNRFAVVVDEYGEVQGLVTLEDILEEIVGDFTTNTADEVEEVIPRGDGSYEIYAVATIREINKATGWALPTDGPKTLNGLALEQLESIPDGNVSFIIDGFKFETEQINETMIKTLIVTCLEPKKVQEE